jgi:hypothetical protein
MVFSRKCARKTVIRRHARACRKAVTSMADVEAEDMGFASRSGGWRCWTGRKDSNSPKVEIVVAQMLTPTNNCRAGNNPEPEPEPELGNRKPEAKPEGRSPRPPPAKAGTRTGGLTRPSAKSCGRQRHNVPAGSQSQARKWKEPPRFRQRAAGEI